MGLRLATSFILLLFIVILAFQNTNTISFHFFTDLSLPAHAFIGLVLAIGIIIGKLMSATSGLEGLPSNSENKPADSGSNLFVGNLPRNIRKDELQNTFSKYGTVKSVKIITDKHSGNPRGFGFVEMTDEPGAKSAIKNLNGYELNGKAINVNLAHTRSGGQRSRGSRHRNYK